MLDPQLNALSPKYEAIFGEKYTKLYNETIVGKRLAHQMSIEEYRSSDLGVLSFGLEEGPQVGEITRINIEVSDPAGTIPLVVYKPQDLKEGEQRPIYVNFHGGGWVIGGEGDDDAFIRHVVKNTGAVAFDVGYRLAPEYKFPIPVLDCWQALQYISANAAIYQGDATRIALGGFSAGGHISAVLSQKARDEGLKGVCFQLLVIPVCDATSLNYDLQVASNCPYKSWREHHDGPFLSHARMSWFYNYFLPQPRDEKLFSNPLLSPIKAKSLANLPPALVVPAEVDVLRDEGIAYGQRLGRENDAFTELWLARGVPHPFCHQYLATDKAVHLRELAIQRLNEAFSGQLKNRKEFISNV